MRDKKERAINFIERVLSKFSLSNNAVTTKNNNSSHASNDSFLVVFLFEKFLNYHIIYEIEKKNYMCLYLLYRQKEIKTKRKEKVLIFLIYYKN